MSTTDEVELPGEVPLSEVPGWRDQFGLLAGITGRGSDPFHPFDLGLGTSRPVGEVMADWRRFHASFPHCPASVIARQVHGDRVLWHDAPATAGWTIVEGADGHATRRSGRLLLVTVADCVPIYLVAPAQHAIALLHAGWRGVAAGILETGVKLLGSQSGARPADIVMHCGVAISGPCYEVGSDVVSSLGTAPVGAGPWHVDLRSVLQDQAAAIGVGEVTISGRCTATERHAFFSHRASGGTDGRMIAWLGWPTTGS